MLKRKGGINFAIRRGECVSVRNMDNYPKKSILFGNHILTTTAIGTAKEAAKEAAKDIIPIQLSERERAIVHSLEKKEEE